MNVEIGTGTLIFLFWNICFKISVFCLCSVEKMTMRQDIGGDNWNVDREANQGRAVLRTSNLVVKKTSGRGKRGWRD
jgi:hypothetical protein